MYWYACVWIASSNAWRSRYCRHSGAEIWRYVPSTMLFAARLSAVTKKPRLRLTISRSSSVRPAGFFHSSMSRCMLISCGIQWFAQPARYLSYAHLYLNGTSWLTSACPLMTRLSSTRTRLKLACSSRCSASCCTARFAGARGIAAGPAEASTAAGLGEALGEAGAVKSSSKLSMAGVSCCSFLCRAKGCSRSVGCRIPSAWHAGAAFSPSVHRRQLVVEELRCEILALEPGDRRKSVIQIELREALAIAQRLELFAMQLVREIDDALASVVELQPDLVVTEPTCVHHVSGCVLVPGQQRPPFAKGMARAAERRRAHGTSRRLPHHTGNPALGEIGARQDGRRRPRTPSRTT